MRTQPNALCDSEQREDRATARTMQWECPDGCYRLTHALVHTHAHPAEVPLCASGERNCLPIFFPLSSLCRPFVVPLSSLCRPFVGLGQVLWWLAAAALLSRMRAKAQQLGLHNSHGSLQQYASFLMSNVPGLSDSAPSGDATVGSATADAVTLDGGVIPFVLARVAAVASRAVSAASTFIAEVPV